MPTASLPPSESELYELDSDQSLYFRDSLRKARHTALGDAEAFLAVIHAIEELGRYLTPNGKGNGLSSYAPALEALARRSAAYLDEQSSPPERIPFLALYHTVHEARNDAVHEGASARHLTSWAIDLSLILEDALAHRFKHVREFMVRDPLTIELWQPLRVARRHMLANSYSFLPFLDHEGTWRLLGDHHLVSLLRAESGHKSLDEPLEKVLERGAFIPDDAKTMLPDASLEDVVGEAKLEPVLVVAPDDSTRLLGILTAFDLL